MKRIIALTALGYDQPGIVASLTECLYNAGCNLEESSMTLLRRDFAIIMLITIPADMSTEHVYQCITPAIDKFRLTVNIRGLMGNELEEASADNPSNYVLSIYGLDKKGIVYKITSVLARMMVNITGSETHTKTDGSKTIYSFFLEIFVPFKCSIETLKKNLADVCRELSVDFSLTAVEEYDEM
ncbi:MAG: hypothetical protein H7A34_08650 [bacterium]|nr:hypothetical protein [bacterium]